MGNSKITQLLDNLYKAKKRLPNFSAIAGFDGFIDIITKPIASSDRNDIKEYFKNVPDFASFISKRAGGSSSVELDEMERKLGGNAPIFANALGTLGVETTCIGTLGYPKIENEFKKMSDNCYLVSVARPGICTALEFVDSKIMLAINGELNCLDWAMVVERVGLDILRNLFKKSNLIGLFNWSETPRAEDIWQGIIRDIVPYLEEDKHVIFDFSDCARRGTQEILNMLDIVREYARQLPTTLSMNENECYAVLKALGIHNNPIEKSGEALREELEVDNIVWHFRDDTWGFTRGGMYRFPIYKIEKPAIVTGAGDNFNAGLSLGLLAGFPMDEAIMTASLTASYYVAYGHSPSIDNLITFIQDQIIQNNFQFYKRKDDPI